MRGASLCLDALAGGAVLYVDLVFPSEAVVKNSLTTDSLSSSPSPKICALFRFVNRDVYPSRRSDIGNRHRPISAARCGLQDVRPDEVENPCRALPGYILDGFFIARAVGKRELGLRRRGDIVEGIVRPPELDGDLDAPGLAVCLHALERALEADLGAVFGASQRRYVHRRYRAALHHRGRFAIA